MRLIALALLTLLAAPAPAQAADCVILLHGLARTHASLTVMAEALSAEGFRVVNRGYPSTRASIADLSPATIQPAMTLQL
jgi:hypothetical protein